MGKNIIIFEKELSQEDEKKIKSNLRKIANSIDAIKEMGFNLYLSPNTLNVCDGDTHVGLHATPDRDVVVASMSVYGIDAGDW